MRLITLILILHLIAEGSTALTAKEPAALPTIEMVDVQGGTFVMGLDESEAEHPYETPRHRVTLSDFRIGKFEVTQKLWEAVTGDNPSSVKGDDLPVESVSWNDVQLFIERLNRMTGKKYRLPTEAEWEYAAMGGRKSAGYTYIGGNNPDNGTWNFNNSDGKSHIVGLLNPNELGIYDMGGNVQEWVQDWYGHYPGKAQKNPKGAKKSDIGKIIRGGCFSNLPQYNKPGCRFVSNPNFKSPDIGFRLAE